MSEPSQPEDGAPAAEPAPADTGVIPVEVEPPDDPPPEAPAAVDPVAALEQKLAVVEKEKKDNWDRVLRATADLENARKRQKRELDDARFDAKNRVLKEILPVVDNLERAVEHTTAAETADDPRLKAIVEGVQLVLRQFQTAFERLDVSPVLAEGQPFDPNVHEAISQQESELAPGTVVQVLQRGYRAGDRLLRPALVVVAKAKAESS
jgi:molecular chaperone GrpE